MTARTPAAIASAASAASALLLVGALTLTAACSHAPSASKPAPARGGPSAEAAEAAAGAAAAAAAGVEPSVVDPATIEGLDVVNDSGNSRFCPWATSYPDVPGATALTAAMRRDVGEHLAEFLGPDSRSPVDCGGDTRSGDPDTQDTRELNISFALLVASGDVVGVRLSNRDRTARTYWYDGADLTYRPALALIESGSRAAFVSALREKARRQGGVGPAALDDLAFTADGGLRAGSAVALDRATVTPWLSEFGRRAQAQTTDPSPTLDLGADHTPTPAVPAGADPGADPTDCSRVKCVALTFDDGPAVPESTTLLQYLAEYDARATFFVVGQNAAAHRAVVRAQADAGHEIGNHSWSHPRLTELSTEEIRSQLARTSEEIRSATGTEPTLFRPPYGSIDDRVRAAAQPLSAVMWDVDPRDWEDRDTDRVTQRVIAATDPGDVILLHDIHRTSVAAVPQILSTLTAGGYHFVTVSHLRATPNALG
ncbi:polysaccharide deacetylase family protein [Streptomyces adelaidensis]|uniref:polysaccharide deacetylase family protein n=1 Tax=Streptomyces adelaidensis TaxID=2796465 RepID=UPI001908BE6E|nr:polysaccharide deacetylase family protein [Streptomyces adelaidensis]